MQIRDARPDDLAAIIRIYNHYVESSVTTFDVEPVTAEQRAEWFAQFGGEFPMLVCEEAGEEDGGEEGDAGGRSNIGGAGGEGNIGSDGDDANILGFAYYLPYRAKPGYDATRETTVYVRAGIERRGVGSALYRELIRRAEAGGVHVLIAVLGGRNRASEALHRKFGFEQVGHCREVGRKFDQWVDTYTWQRILK